VALFTTLDSNEVLALFSGGLHNSNISDTRSAFKTLPCPGAGKRRVQNRGNPRFSRWKDTRTRVSTGETVVSRRPPCVKEPICSVSALCCRSSPRGSRNTKSDIATCGPRCRLPCAKLDSTITRCSCATMAFWLAIWRRRTLSAPVPEWPSGKSTSAGNARWATFSFSPTACCPIAPCSRWKKSFICNSDTGTP